MKSNTSGLSGYFKKVGERSLLTADQEIELAQRIEKGDKLARSHMIEANIRLAISIAKNYTNTGCSLEDLIQESSVGLINAVDRYDWRKGFKFSTYAVWWIKQSVRKHVSSQASHIKLPANGRNILWKMNVMKKEYEEEFGTEPTLAELADLLNVKKSTLDSLIKSSRSFISIDATIGSDGEGRKIAEVIPDESESIDTLMERTELAEIVRSAMKTLTPREEMVLRMRFGISESETDHKNFPITASEINILKEKSNEYA